MKPTIKSKVILKVNEARAKLTELVGNKIVVDARSLMNEGKKYVERQGKEIKKLISDDAAKVKGFLEKEMKELKKLQMQIPTDAKNEVKKIKEFLHSQGKELEKLLHTAKATEFKEKAQKVTQKVTMRATETAKKAAGKAKAAATDASSKVRVKVKSRRKTTSDKGATL